MARFARDLLKKAASTTKALEVTLGPDTGDLTLRIGMHSGPVTAGVLRGERARFQLFGDTMNTTQRIESSGSPGRIHVSADTAENLIQAGKQDWLIERGELVQLKGKGEMATFWLSDRIDVAGTVTSGSDRASDDDKPLNSEFALSGRHSRLVGWNVETLCGLLEKVVASRTDKAGSSIDPKRKSLVHSEQKSVFVDDVQETISIPEFDGRGSTHTKKVSLDPVVVEQLREYVSTIACWYRNNSFHSFEHASHVMMSVTKLMSRIVAPSDNKFTMDSMAHSVATAATLHDHTYGITSDPMIQFASAFAAMIHDVDHTGVPNAQLIKEDSILAARYEGRSVAEQNSLSISLSLLMADKFAKFRNTLITSDEELAHFRQLVINMVMATDIVDKDLKALRNARWERAFAMKSNDELLSPEANREIVNRKATIVIEHLIQASDVSHTMQHWHIYRKWNERFFMECYEAYRKGRADTDPTVGWYKGELGFFDFYIIPLAKKLKECGVFGIASGEYLDYAIRNRSEWEAKGQEVVEEMARKVQTLPKESDHSAPFTA